MILSLFVYSFIAFIMIYDGSIAAIKQSNSVTQKLSFFQPEIIFPLFIFAIIFGCRYDVGVDHLAYLKSYETGFEVDRFEPLFRWIMKMFSSYGLHFSIFFSFLAFLQVFFLFYSFKDERFLYPWLSFVLIFGSYFLPFMNIMRQMIASCIFLYSVQFIVNRNILKYFVCVIIAALFHRSSWILLLLYPLFIVREDYFKKISLQFILLAASLIFYFNVDLILNGAESLITYFSEFLGYEKYSLRLIERLTSEKFGRGTGLGIIVLLIQNTLIILYSNRLKEFFPSKRFIIFYNLFFIGTFIEISCYDLLMLSRPFRSFIFIKMIVVSYLLYYLFFHSKRTIDKYVFLFFILQYFILFLNMISLDGINKVQFKFFWQYLS